MASVGRRLRDTRPSYALLPFEPWRDNRSRDALLWTRGNEGGKEGREEREREHTAKGIQLVDQTSPPRSAILLHTRCIILSILQIRRRGGVEEGGSSRCASLSARKRKKGGEKKGRKRRSGTSAWLLSASR